MSNPDRSRMLEPARRRGLSAQYAAFVREEPRARAFLGATWLDEVGVAVSGWAVMLMMTRLMETQRARASLMLPSLACFLIGALISGPLADWVAHSSAAALARWRWRVVLVGRALETALLGWLALQLALQPWNFGLRVAADKAAGELPRAESHDRLRWGTLETTPPSSASPTAFAQRCAVEVVDVDGSR